MIRVQDKKILIVAGVCISITFLFWAFIYFPANKRLHFLKSELDSIRKEISEIESHGAKAGPDIVKMVEALQRDLKEALQKLPEQEEETLRLLSKEADKLGIEIVSISPAPKRPVLDANNNPIFLEEKQCFEMPVSIQMKGLYKSIGEYLAVLREGIPPLIRVEDIKIEKDETISPRLKVSLELALCLLC